MRTLWILLSWVIQRTSHHIFWWYCLLKTPSPSTLSLCLDDTTHSASEWAQSWKTSFNQIGSLPPLWCLWSPPSYVQANPRGIFLLPHEKFATWSLHFQWKVEFWFEVPKDWTWPTLLWRGNQRSRAFDVWKQQHSIHTILYCVIRHRTNRQEFVQVVEDQLQSKKMIK